MYKNPPPGQTIEVIQNAYVVNDLEESAERWYENYGVGPFLVLAHLRMPKNLYHGKEMGLYFSASFAQAGDVQLEFIQQYCDNPSCYKEMYPDGGEGFHHQAYIAKDYDTEFKRWTDLGCPAANEFVYVDGRRIAYMDTRKFNGHYLEIYQDGPGIHGLYEQVRNARANWDGKHLLYTITEKGLIPGIVDPATL